MVAQVKRSALEMDAVLKALAHKDRRTILRYWIEEGNPTMSPRDFTQIVAQPLSNISYHVRCLAQCGLAREVRTKKVRGATQHFYKASGEALSIPWLFSMLSLDIASKEPQHGDDR